MKSFVYGMSVLFAASNFAAQSTAFQLPAANVGTKYSHTKGASNLYAAEATKTPGKGFGKVEEKKEKEQKDPMEMRPDDIKELLIELLPRMTGTEQEFKLVEEYVNALEDKFVPAQTLDFLNLAMNGEWQFLFTTNQLGRPSPILRLTELVQKVQVNGLEGSLVNQARWDLVDEGSTFDCNGSFESTTSYNINQGARMTINEDHDLAINLGKGSKVPSDMQALVGLIHRAMPTEMFDASTLALDTTYLDAEIRIVRFTGSRHEGVRNIFMRKGAIEINPNL
jgi:hypothetical protein